MDIPDDNRGNSKRDTSEASGGQGHKGIGSLPAEDTHHASHRTRWQRLKGTLGSPWPTIVIGVLTLFLVGLTYRNDRRQTELQNQQFRFQETVQVQNDNIRATQAVIDSDARATMDAQAEAQIAIQRAQATIDHDRRNIDATQVALAEDIKRIYERSEFALVKVIETQTKLSLQGLTLDSRQNLHVVKSALDLLLENEGGGSTIFTSAQFQSGGGDLNSIKVTNLSAIDLNLRSSPEYSNTSYLPVPVDAHSGLDLHVQWEYSAKFIQNISHLQGDDMLPSDIEFYLEYSNGDKNIVYRRDHKLDSSQFIHSIQSIIDEEHDSIGSVCFILIPWLNITNFILDFQNIKTNVEIDRCYAFPTGQYYLILHGHYEDSDYSAEIPINIVQNELIAVNVMSYIQKVSEIPLPAATIMISTVTPSDPSIDFYIDREFSFMDILILLLLLFSVMIFLFLSIRRIIPWITVRMQSKQLAGYILICRAQSPESPVLSLKQVAKTRRTSFVLVGSDERKCAIYVPGMMPAEFLITKKNSQTVIYDLRSDQQVGRIKQGFVTRISTSFPDIVLILGLDRDQLRCDFRESELGSYRLG